MVSEFFIFLRLGSEKKGDNDIQNRHTQYYQSDLFTCLIVRLYEVLNIHVTLL